MGVSSVLVFSLSLFSLFVSSVVAWQLISACFFSVSIEFSLYHSSALLCIFFSVSRLFLKSLSFILSSLKSILVILCSVLVLVQFCLLCFSASPPTSTGSSVFPNYSSCAASVSEKIAAFSNSSAADVRARILLVNALSSCVLGRPTKTASVLASTKIRNELCLLLPIQP